MPTARSRPAFSWRLGNTSFGPSVSIPQSFLSSISPLCTHPYLSHVGLEQRGLIPGDRRFTGGTLQLEGHVASCQLLGRCVSCLPTVAITKRGNDFYSGGPRITRTQTRHVNNSKSSTELVLPQQMDGVIKVTLSGLAGPCAYLHKHFLKIVWRSCMGANLGPPPLSCLERRFWSLLFGLQVQHHRLRLPLKGRLLIR